MGDWEAHHAFEGDMALDFLRRADREREQYGDRIPPNQRLTDGWPVLTYGNSPRIDRKEWRVVVAGFWEQYGYHIRGDPWKEERYS